LPEAETKQDCVFCRIATHELPATVVHEDEHTIAFRDLDPRAPLHVLIIPKRHVGSVNDVSDADAMLMGRLFVAARHIAAAEGVAERGYRVVMNTGNEAGQSVAHAHLHLLGGRTMKWPPG
jgi:histidine triad (HIT) family protein